MSANYNRPKRAAKLVVWERDNWTCQHCGVKVEIVPEHPFPPHAATVDHVIPLSAGGSNMQGNLVTSCFECNQRKGGSLPAPPVPSALAIALQQALALVPA